MLYTIRTSIVVLIDSPSGGPKCTRFAQVYTVNLGPAIVLLVRSMRMGALSVPRAENGSIASLWT